MGCATPEAARIEPPGLVGCWWRGLLAERVALIQWGQQERLAFIEDGLAAEHQTPNRAMPIFKLDGVLFQVDVDAGELCLIWVGFALHISV